MRVKTKRLTVSPMTDAEAELQIENEPDEELKAAYREMRDAAASHPEQRLWYCSWVFRLRKTGETVGNACFFGPPSDGAVAVGYGILPGKEGNGYATEALTALTGWAFEQEGVFFLEAETAPDNKASQRVLEKLGFLPDGDGREGPRFLLEKPASAWISVCMSMGLCLGLCFGSAWGELPMGMCFGLPIGVAVGAALDAADRKKRTQLKQLRAQRNPTGSD